MIGCAAVIGMTNRVEWKDTLSMEFACFASDWCPAPARAPDDTTIFAIGDVHGCAAQFNAMTALIRDRASECAHGTIHLVTIGDYVDRGPDSLGVLGSVVDLSTASWASVHTLLGNHDRFLADFLDHPALDLDTVELWRFNGGDRTMAELGISYYDVYRTPLAKLRQRARDALAHEIRALIGGLRTSLRLGGWLFVHAGVDPAKPLAEHTPAELIWMRQPFLQGVGWSHDFCVVHGHTIRGHEVRPHRVAIDSGAYHTGILSGVEIEGDRLRFLAVGPDPDLDRLMALPGHSPDRRYTALPRIRVTAD